MHARILQKPVYMKSKEVASSSGNYRWCHLYFKFFRVNRIQWYFMLHRRPVSWTSNISSR